MASLRMHPALTLLMKLQARAVLRRTLRGMRTPKGAVFILIAAVMLIIWTAPLLFSTRFMPPSDPQRVRMWAPLILLLMCAFTLFGGAGDRVISFTQGEVNFLFPGPFTRRQLLIYKLARTFLGGVFSGLIFSLVLLRHASSFAASFVASVLALLLVQLLTVAVVLAGQVVGERVYFRGRRVVLGIVVAVVAIAVVPRVREITAGGAGAMQAVAETLHQSAVARVLLAPLQPYVRAFTAQSIGELLLWASAAVAIDAALLVLILRLDADYREAALAASQRQYERLQRVRRGMIPQVGKARGPRRSLVGMFPWLGGAGPTAWRQATAAVRTSRGTLVILAIMSAGIVPTFFVGQKAGVAPVLMTTGWGTMMFTMMLKFDFRGELDQMAWLKALPLSPTATAAGQLAVPVLYMTLVQVLLLSTAAIIATPPQRLILLAILPFLLPFNVLLFGVENLMFLLFPSRVAGAAPGDLGLMGRQIVFFLAKMIALALAAGLAGAAGGIAYAFSRSVVAGILVAFVALCAVAGSMVPLIGLAYKRFDPSRDTPA